MKVFYDEGMPVMNFSDAGDFRIGEPKEVRDDLAKELLRKGRVKIWEEKQTTEHTEHTEKKKK
jgi:hypothetical protein